MKVKIVSALLMLVTVFSATAANARPYFAVNPEVGVPVVAQSCGSAQLVSYRGGYYPPPYYYHHHRRWHRHW